MQNRFMAVAGTFERGNTPPSIPFPHPRRSLGAGLLWALFALLLLAAPHAQAAPGDVDSLNALVAGPGGGSVTTTAVQPDGKIILAGNFTSVLGVARQNVARLNADGTLDLGFDVRTSAPVATVAVQADGKVVLGGSFVAIQGTGSGVATTRNYVGRVNANGTLDSSFNPHPDGVVYSVAVQADGKVLMGGEFTLLDINGNFALRNHLARINADGTLDTGFNPGGGTVYSMAMQPDGKVLVGSNNVRRLNADGTGDTGFTAGAISVPTPASPHVYGVAVQADGKVVIGGEFTGVGGTTRNYIARLNTNGTLDMGFDPNANNIVRSVVVQADGKVLFGGAFSTVQPNGSFPAVTRNRIARVNANGTLDTAFDPNLDSDAYGIVLQADGKALLTGKYTTLQPNGAVPTARNYFARLQNDAATQILTAPSATQVLWTRGGAAPELNYATFELSTNGGANWSLLPGTATRIGTTPNWQLTGLSLPLSGQLRARGRTAGGYYSNGGSLLEQVISFSFPAEIAVTGNGVNIADGDSTPAAADHTDFGVAVPGATTVVRTFTITNTGNTALNLTGTPKVVVSGANAADFAVTLQPASPVAGTNGTTTFQVTFTPGAAGVRNATLSLATNDPDENPFDFAVTGRGLSFTVDTDGDGLNDASELMGAALGFDWQASQPALVQTYQGMASGAGLYTAAQVQTLNAGTPLISRDPSTGKFKLTLSLIKATTLSSPNWLPFPFAPAGTTINGQGQVEFQFTTPDNAAFFRLQSN